jgi:hypothetical protein
MNEETLKEIRDILKQIEQNTRRPSAAMDARVFDQWLDQYVPDIDISDEGALLDPEPYVPTQAASLEEVENKIKEHKAWEERQKFRNNSVNCVRSPKDYYI